MMFPERPLPSSQLIMLSLRALRVTLPNILVWLVITVIIAGIAYFYNAHINALGESAVVGYQAHPNWVVIKNSHIFMQLGYPLIAVAVIVWLLLVMLYQAQASLSKKPLDDSIIISANKRYFPFLISIVMTLIILALLLPVILLYIFILPIIIFAPVAVAMDKYGIFAAFKHAWQLVWGNWWHTFFVILLAVFMPLFIVAIISAICAYIIHNTAYIGAIATTIGLFVVLPLLVNVLLILYNDLRLRYNAQP